MKRITLFLTVCLGLSVFQTVFADNTENARATTKRGPVNTVTTNTGSKRSNTSSAKNDQKRSETTKSTTKTNRSTANIQTRTMVTPKQTVKQRSAVSAPQSKTVNARTTSSVNTRNFVVSRTASTNKTKNIPNTTRTPVTKQSKHITRATQLNDAKIQEIKSKDYSKCKTVYWECMDEFCANKDTDLRRCACSSRIHEFDDVKKQLTDAEEKMFEFNQRLLTVGMDKEDVSAIGTPTEGELASAATEDRSESEKLLQKITNALNDSGESKITNNLSSISLDLDIENAWDSVDSISGIATSAKSGLALYDAVQPVCIEMAQEVCSDDELSVTKRSYELAIQQDCNTVKSAYNSKYNETIGKIHDSGALLDMARLNAYQSRNSDDILTCKRKILDKLSDSAICGEKLYKCLDITGQYINPADGSVFLSDKLSNLTTLITAPTSSDSQWSVITSNAPFVAFLNSKKDALKSATEKCQDMSDTIWKEFLDDALARIKLEQNNKLEEIRRSCTKLVTECKKNTAQNLKDFDENALLTFNVLADATVNTMCSDITNACTALMDTTFDDTSWASGMAGLETDASYDTMIETCTEIGRICFTQKCSGTSGNFVACRNNDSAIRSSILMTEYCWDEIQNCVEQSNILDNIDTSKYNDNFFTAYKNCDTNDKACLITHEIWGDCTEETTVEGSTIKHEPDSTRTIDFPDTLLALLYNNTNNPSCYASCESGYTFYANYYKYPTCRKCAKQINITLESVNSENHKNTNYAVYVTENDIGYCLRGCAFKDEFGNCCASGNIDITTGKSICTTSNAHKAVPVQTVQCTGKDNYYCPDFDTHPNKKMTLYCVTNDVDYNTNNLVNYTDSNGNLRCPNDGYWLIIDEIGNYFNPQDENAGIYSTPKPQMWYYKSTQKCDIKYNGTEWTLTDNTACTLTDTLPKNKQLGQQIKLSY